MRKIFIPLFLLLSASFCQADPFAHLNDIQEQPRSTFIADIIQKTDTVTYCIASAEDPSWIEDSALNEQVLAAFKEWTFGIALRIRAAGRAEEFKDLLPILEKNINFKRLPSCDISKHQGFTAIYPEYKTNPQTADVTIIISEKYCKDYLKHMTSFFTYDYKDAPPFMCLFQWKVNPYTYKQSDYLPTALNDKDNALAASMPQTIKDIAYNKAYTKARQDSLWAANRLFYYDDEPTYFSLVAHELGHAFGLADEYENNSRDASFSTKTRGEGLMRHGYSPITCDEVDGMITLTDRFSDTKRTFKSFCNDTTYFENGIEKSSAELIKVKNLTKEIKKDLNNPRALSVKELRNVNLGQHI